MLVQQWSFYAKIIADRGQTNKNKEDMKNMGREVILFKTEERSSTKETAAFLRQLADKIEQGKVTLRSGTQEIDLLLPSMITLETKVEEEEKHGKTKRSLEIELEWREGAEDEGAGGVTIA